MTETLDGGCHCGAVRYRLIGAPIFVNACHCRDCQKLTGSAFALNAMIEADRVQVAKGEPETDAYGCRRCPSCNVLLWAMHPMFGDAIVFLRAGTLDAAEQVAPDAHFFVRSKHPWIRIPDGLPSFQTGPGRDERLFNAAQQARVDAAMAG